MIRHDDPIDAVLLHQLLEDCPLGSPFHWLPEATSTNDLALVMGNGGEPHGCTVVAEAQSQGRGRLGRRWVAPPGSAILVSILVRLGHRASPVGLLAGVGGLAAAAALERETDLAVSLKWPNDLIVQERKLGGVLVEAGGLRGSQPFAVIGIGLNVNAPSSEMPLDLRDAAISVRDATGRCWDRTRLLAAVLKSLSVAYDEWGVEPAGILDAWQSKECTLGQAVRAYLPDGTVLTGTARHLAPDGSLVVEDALGERVTLASGEVSLRRA